MKGFIYSAASAVALVVASVGAQAAVFTGGFTVQANTDSENGLAISTANLLDLTNFAVNAGSPRTAALFDIWTDESSINADDFNSRDITVTFNFTDPSAVGGAIVGQTVGDGTVIPFFQWIVGDNGQLSWTGGTQIFDFGSNRLQIELSGTDFNGGLFDLHPGRRHGGTVEATFTLLPAVPEPATWAMMIAGFAMVGGSMRSRKTSIAYA